MTEQQLSQLKKHISPSRVEDLAVALVNAKSHTSEAGPAADCLAEQLRGHGLAVTRVEARWKPSPAVVSYVDSGKPGKTLQFNGHLDTVPLPYSPAKVQDGFLTGSGAADMKGGVAAMCEAALALRDSGMLQQGRVMITAQDLHEAPWGDNHQLEALIDEGHHGDAVLIPEYLVDRIPIVSRGMAILKVTYSRPGEAMHEVAGGMEQPHVTAAAADLALALRELDCRLATQTHPLAGRASTFVGQLHGGEIYNQSPTSAWLQGTRRWLPGTNSADVRAELQALVQAVASKHGVCGELSFFLVRDAMEMNPANPLVDAFQTAYEQLHGQRLPLGSKPFVDDANTFLAKKGIPAITHGPVAKGAHTTSEIVALSELERVALLYAATALEFCK